jgi:hypothetical protein
MVSRGSGPYRNEDFIAPVYWERIGWVQPQFGTKAEISSGRTRFAALNLSCIHQRVTSIGQLLVNANRGEWESGRKTSLIRGFSPTLLVSPSPTRAFLHKPPTFSPISRLHPSWLARRRETTPEQALLSCCVAPLEPGGFFRRAGDHVQTRVESIFVSQSRVLPGCFVQKLIHSPVDNSGIDKAFPRVLNDGFCRTGRDSSHSSPLVDKVIHKHRLACG